MPPTPPMGNHSPLSGFDKVDPTPIDSFGLRPSRHRNQELLPPSPVPIGPFATLPTPSPKVLATPQPPKIATAGIADEHHVATVPTVPAVRATARNMSLPSKAHAPIPTSPPLNPDFGFVVHQLGE